MYHLMGFLQMVYMPSISHQTLMPPSVMHAVRRIIRLQPCMLPLLCWGATPNSV
jgi:hypothetical protein